MFKQVHCDVTTLFVTTSRVPESPWKEFGAWIKDARLKANLSQAGAANRTGIDRQQWYRIENGLSGTKRETVIKIAAALSLNEKEALNRAGFGSGEPPITEPTTVRELKERLWELGVQIEFEQDLDDDNPENLERAKQSIAALMNAIFPPKK